MNIFSLLGNALSQISNGDPVLLIAYVISIAFVIWLYKAVNNYITNNDSNSVAQIEERLGVYGCLQINIALYLKEENGEQERKLYESIGESFPYISSRIHIKVKEFLNEPNKEKLKEISSLIDEEISVYKEIQEKISSYIQKQDEFTRIEYFFDLIKKVGKPIVMTATLVFLIIILYLLVIIMNEQQTIIGKLSIVINFLTLFFVYISFLGIKLLIKDKRYKHSVSSWLSSFLFLLVSFFLTFIKFGEFFYSITALGIMLCFIFYIVPCIRVEKSVQ
ncbi:hypothetical protein P4S95_23550 [Aneurinibacillus aneurinilyticus]|uniref:hypothetical protein n=1 Tax=Aneurinibacillus aneurinilyticus TaxID=1391 RepID=UPI002E20E0F1|nr:hypothetical protein [Aneurinibacillus aneurinilyticus]